VVSRLSHFAMMQNIIVIVQLIILVIYTVILFWHIINKSFDTHEMQAPFLGNYNYNYMQSRILPSII